VALPGDANARHDYWVFPAVVERPQDFIAALRRQGFDAAGLSRNQAVAAPDDRPQLQPVAADALLARLVILPCYDGLPDRELERLARLVREAAPRPEAAPARAAE
jgi:dTDP-4-amino-4,6-dideoxygalactose transaminase